MFCWVNFKLIHWKGDLESTDGCQEQIIASNSSTNFGIGTKIKNNESFKVAVPQEW